MTGRVKSKRPKQIWSKKGTAATKHFPLAEQTSATMLRMFSRTSLPARTVCRQLYSQYSSFSMLNLPMKPGTPIKGLDIFKGKDAPVAMERSEYPDWVSELPTPLPSLAKLRRMSNEDATDKDKRRFLKLTRRAKIKSNNLALANN